MGLDKTVHIKQGSNAIGFLSILKNFKETGDIIHYRSSNRPMKLRKSLLLLSSFQTSPPPSSSPPKSSEEADSPSEVETQQLNGSSTTSAIGQSLELAPLAQPIPCALASRDNQSEGVEVEAPCCLDDCPSDGALQKEE